MHDLQRIRQDLQESLSLDKHPVAVLFGAGCPTAVRIPKPGGGTDPLIPDIAGLTRLVKQELADNESYHALEKQFTDDGLSFTVEDLLSRVRVLRRIVGKGEARGLTATAIEELEKNICSKIVTAVRRELPGPDTPYHYFADWIGGIPRMTPVELFTPNYDVLMEQALEDKCLPFFDGFVGARQPFFDLRAIEDDAIPLRWTRLWKVHGCATWALDSTGKVTRACYPSAVGEGLLIHPSELKYDQSRRMPYLAMIDRLRAFLRKPSAFVVTIGYAYADEHLNEVLLQGLRSNPSAAAFGLLFKKLAEEKAAHALSKRVPINLSLLAQDRGVVRNREAEFQVDATGGGAVVTTTNDLGDFVKFASFLRSFVAMRGS